MLFRSTDFDPAFFVRTHDRDWRALLLLNLTLLSVHVNNMALDSVGRGWATVVRPLLNQLIARRNDYDCIWLFLTRCVDVSFETAKDTSDFGLQRIFASIATSYFYGGRRRDTVSFKHDWKNMGNNTEELNEYWSEEKNKTSWPPSWMELDEQPLITQLVNLLSARHV